MSRYLDKVLLGFATFFVVFMTFTGGIEVGQNHFTSGITDLVLAIFFLGIVAAVMFDKLNDLRAEIHANMHENEHIMAMLDLVQKAVESVDKPAPRKRRTQTTTDNVKPSKKG